VSAPVDGAVRARAVSEVSSSFAVSAGAGSGKTSVLVARLVQHLLDGTGPDQIAAITFTEKAASELTGRARDALEAALAAAPAGSPAAASAQEALDRFGELTLSTIHSFCQQLLQHEPLAAGWAPDSEVIGDLPDDALEQCYRRWRDGFDRRHPDDAELLRKLANESSPYPGTASIRGLADALLANRDLTPLVGAGGAAVDPAAAAGALRGLVAQAAAAANQCSNADRCKLYNKCAPLLEALAPLPALSDAALVQAALGIGIVKPGRIGAKKDWPGTSKADLIAAVNGFRDWKADLQKAMGVRLHGVLVGDLLEQYLPAILAERAALARADFSDLLFRARDLLLDSPAARARLSDRYRVLLVDEVQDTDPIQAEVAALLSRPLGASGAWDAAAPVPGSLFAVGDPRQSIYRFRRADVATWAALQGLIARDGAALELTQNFRSVPGIVRWVGHTFPDAAQAPWRPAAALPPVSVIQCPDKDSEVEAAVQYLRSLLDQGAQVADPETGALRPAQPGDIMILLPAWSHADALQRRLRRAGIPVAVEGDKQLYARDEVRLVLDALRAIAEPTETTAVLCVLRGLFGLSHADLARHRAADGSWGYTRRTQPPGPVAEALGVLRQLHKLRGQRSWAAIVDTLLDETGADAVWAMTGRRWQALANLDKLRATLRQLEGDALTAGEVIERVALLSQAGQPELSTVDDVADAVRVTTYFKAKGLEAPIVLLVRADRRLVPPPEIVLREQGLLAAAAGTAVAPPGWDAIREAEKAALQQERRRWVYVAVTRARDHLAIVRSKASTLLRGTLDAGLDGTEPASHGDVVDIAPGAPVQVLHAASLPPAPDIRETFPGLDAQVDAILSAPRPSAGDRGGLERARADRAAIRAAHGASTRWQTIGRPRPGGSLRGRVVHQTVHSLDLSKPVSLEEARRLLDQCAHEAGLREDDRRWCELVVRHIVDQPAVRAAQQARRCFQRMSTLGTDYGTALSGEIDLCYQDAGGQWVVVDWQAHLQRPPAAFLDAYPGRLRRLMARLLGADVTVCLVAPPAVALPETDEETAAALLELAEESLLPLCRRLLDRGECPEPLLDVGSPRVIATLELAWPARRWGVGLDLSRAEVAALEGDGWLVHNADTTAPDWVEAVEAAVAAAVV